MSVSPRASPNTSCGFNASSSFGEPPRKIFPEVAFEDLSASFKNLYKSVFDASQGGENYGEAPKNEEAVLTRLLFSL